jgi:hypothetical protein
MAFQTGTASDRGDLLVKWFNFLQANGWTADVDFASAAQSPAYGIIQRKIDNASPLGSDPLNEVNLHCGFSLSSDGAIIWAIPMDDYTSGDPVNGGVRVATSTAAYDTTYSGTIHLVAMNLVTEPYDNYWFFESDYYAHMVVEYSTGFYRHFGMGQLVRAGKYWGGEYYMGTYRQQSATHIDSMASTQNNDPWDGRSFNTDGGFVLRARNIDGSAIHPSLSQSPVTMWHANYYQEVSTRGTDTDGVTRGALFLDGAHSGPRGPIAEMGLAAWSGHRPMWPINVFHQYAGDTPDTWRLLGAVPDVRAITMQGDLQGGDEFTIGADTWVAFPTIRKRETLVFDDTEQSGLLGVAYKKVT